MRIPAASGFTFANVAIFISDTKSCWLVILRSTGSDRSVLILRTLESSVFSIISCTFLSIRSSLFCLIPELFKSGRIKTIGSSS